MVAEAGPVEMVISRVTRLEPPLLAALVESGRSDRGESARDEWMLPVIAARGMLFIARNGVEIIGAAELIRCIDPSDLYLEGFYIRPSFQKRGFGSRLLTGVMGMIAGQGFTRLLATQDPANNAASKLYEKAGFCQIDFLSDYYGAGRHRLLLAASLTDLESQ